MDKQVHSSMGPISAGSVFDAVAQLNEIREKRKKEEYAKAVDNNAPIANIVAHTRCATGRGDNSA